VLGRRPRVDLFDLAALAAFGAVSVWVLGLDLWQVVVHGHVWTGTDGEFLADQMQYLAWIQDASHHVLASDLFVIHRTPADYFQPLIAISGGFTALGIPAYLVLLLWKPVAVLCAFFVIREYVRRFLTGLWERRAALVLGVFFGSWGVLGDVWLPFWSWGYPFGLIAIAALAGAILLYDRARADNRFTWAPGLLGALASSLHPWQGEVWILIVIAAEALLWGQSRRRLPAVAIRPAAAEPAVVGASLLARDAGEPAAPDALEEGATPNPATASSPVSLTLPIVTVIATGVPLAYLAILGRVDLSWRLARVASHHSFPLASILLALAPLLVGAAFTYRGRPRGFLSAATRLWPLAALAVYVVSATSLSATPLHAFAGITIPLGVLAVEGVQRAGWRRLPGRRVLGALAVAALTIPAAVYEMRIVPQYTAPALRNANFISHDMSRALAYLKADPEPGGVLTRAYLGVIVPAETDRNTYVGGCQWSTPHCARRVIGSSSLFGATMRPPAARAFVLGTAARFVLSGCNWSGDLATVLAPIIQSVRHFGCATVYEIRDRS
jgi:hypothetical protein